MKRWTLLLLSILALNPLAWASLSYSGPLSTVDPDAGLSFSVTSSSLPSLAGLAQTHHGGGYWDEYDDFYFSRRIRRFHRRNRARVTWGYFDPFYTNDIYYVINTPYWNRWNNWYSPWRTRSVIQTNFWLGGVNFNVGVYSAGWNPWGYDPWVYANPWSFSAGFYQPVFAYSYNPWRFNNGGWGWNCGYGGSFNRGFRNGFQNGYAFGYNNGFNGGWYNAGGGGGFSNDYWWRRNDQGYANTVRTPNSRPVNRNNLPQGSRQEVRRPSSSSTEGLRYETPGYERTASTNRTASSPRSSQSPAVRSSASDVRRTESNNYSRSATASRSTSPSYERTQPSSSYERPSTNSRSTSPSYERTQPSSSYERPS
ncbi:MAG: hypothetical protein NWR72_19795, partial [Bacteroidia bacterium]|nr:hypothetical protein [Bacteroidia bacterium]